MNNKYSGSALITALFIMTLISIIVTSIAIQLRQDLERTNLSIVHNQQKYAAEAVVYWAISSLSNPEQKIVSQNPDGIILNYPEKLSKIYPNIQLTGHVIDLQAKFNLNNIRDPIFRILFYQLIKNTVPDIKNTQLNKIIYALINWIMPYQPPTSITTPNIITYYTQQKPAYLPANLPMQDVSELKLIEGVTPHVYQSLSKYITTLPDILPINLNTAPIPILKSLGNGLTESQANKLLKLRTEQGITNFQTLKVMLNNFNIPSQQVTADSNYFLVVTKASTAINTQNYYTVLKRYNNKHGNIVVHVIRSSNYIN